MSIHPNWNTGSYTRCGTVHGGRAGWRGRQNLLMDDTGNPGWSDAGKCYILSHMCREMGRKAENRGPFCCSLMKHLWDSFLLLFSRVSIQSLREQWVTLEHHKDKPPWLNEEDRECLSNVLKEKAGQSGCSHQCSSAQNFSTNQKKKIFWPMLI